MFTGLVSDIGRVTFISISSDNTSAVIRVKVSRYVRALLAKRGDSVSVSGVCLTITKINIIKREFEFFVSNETLNVTKMKYLKLGDYVNIEYAVKSATPLGGHIVTGHVDEIATIQDIKIISKGQIVVVVKISNNSNNTVYVIQKGSICLDGISLTVNSVVDGLFEVCIIPHTFHNTTVQHWDLERKNLVNIEYDYIAKTKFVGR